MSCDRCCTVLKQHVIPFFRLNEGYDKYYQEDGGPPHYSTAACAILDAHSPNRWIGRREPVEWPLRYPDLSVHDFFLWDALRDYVRRIYAQRYI